MCGTSKVNPSLSVYQLSCSVCKGQFSGRNNWLRHLTQENHQKLARLECLEKWDSELRKCSLLLFTSSNLTTESAEEIVNYFSNHLNDNAALVTDFVWWGDRPQLGILQFESRGKVKDVLKEVGSGSNGSSEISIGSSGSVQVRAGSKLMELEWQAILPQKSSASDIMPSTKGSYKADQNVRKASSMEPEMEEHDHSRSSKRLKLDELVDNSVIKSKQVCTSSPKSHPNFLHSDKPPPPFMTSASHPLQFEYWAIRKAVLIPDNQYNQAMEAVSSLKNVLSKLDPNLEVHLIRNWYIKLKSPAQQQDLLLFVHKPNETSENLCPKLREFFSYQIHLKDSFQLVETPKENANDGILQMNYLPTNLKVSLITPKVPGSLLEFQVCRMLEYLCQFDSRCHALITLVYYWATINSINLGGESPQPENPFELPPHYTIHWLIIFFMARGKYIPTPRQIQKESFPKDLALTDDTSGTTIGFSWDPSYIQSWKKSKAIIPNKRRDYCVSVDENSDEFMISLLHLFHKFRRFYQGILGENADWILNTLDSVLINMNDLNDAGATGGRQGKVDCRWKNVVRKEDVIELRNAVEMEKCVKGKCEIYMTHPFLASQKIPLSDDIKVKFRELSFGDGKMDAFLKHVKNFGVTAALTNWLSLKDVLTN